MNKPVKLILGSAVALMLLVVLVIAVALLVVNPNRYKEPLQALVAGQTGLELQVAGDMTWSFSPVFGLNLTDLRLRNEAARQELVSIAELNIKLAPWELLKGDIVLEEVLAHRLHLNHFTDAQGISNWGPACGDGEGGVATNGTTVPGPASCAGSPVSPEVRTGSEEMRQLKLAINRIEVSNASAAINNVQEGYKTRLTDLRLTSAGTNLENEPFPLELSFLLRDLTSGAPLPVSLSTSASVDYSAGSARFEELSLNLSPLLISGGVTVDDFHEDLSWRGQLNSNTFTLSHLLDNLGISGTESSSEAPGAINTQSEQTRIEVEISGDRNNISVSALEISLDDIHAEVDAEIRRASGSRPTNIVYNLSANAVDLTHYLNTPSDSLQAADSEAEQDVTAAGRQAANTGAAEGAAVPVDLLNNLNVVGHHTVESLRAGELEFGRIEADLTLADGILDLEIQPTDFYSGKASAFLSLDSRRAVPAITAETALSAVDLEELSSDVPLLQFIKGLINFEAEYQLEGPTVSELLDSANGTSSFSVRESVVDVSLLKQIFATISALSPSGGSIQDWPDQVQLDHVVGYLVLNDGFDEDQELKLRMDNFDITGTGGMNLQTGDFNYDMLFTVLGFPFPQTIPINAQYRDISWPIQCSANMADDPSRYCRPDLSEVRELFAQMSRDEVESRLDDVVTDDVPEGLQETARDFLRNIFR